jgi:hypothetical protein
LYEEGKVDDTTMIKMAVFKEKVAELMKESGLTPTTKHILLATAIPAAIGLGAAAGKATYEYFSSKKTREGLRSDAQRVFDEIYSSPEIGKYPREEAQQYFKTLEHFSPHIATDPLSAKTFLLQMLEWYDESSAPISPTTVRDLAEIENKAMDAFNKRVMSESTFDIGAFTEPIVSAVSKKPENLFTKIMVPKPLYDPITGKKLPTDTEK